MRWLGGYKRAVEDKLNNLVEAKVTRWEELVHEHRGRSDIIILSLSVVYFTILASSVIYSAREIWNQDGQLLAYLFLAAMAVMASLSIASVAGQAKAYNLAYRTATKLLREQRAHQKS